MPRRTSPNAGFTLLEVILALVILGGSVAVLGEIMRMASRAAVDAAAETRAQTIAASVMDQLAVGALEMREATQEQVEIPGEASWVYSIAFLPCDVEGVESVEVVVEQDFDDGLGGVEYRLIRWLPTDPVAAAEEEMAADEPANDATSGGRNAL